MNRIRWDVIVPMAMFALGIVLGSGVAQEALNDTWQNGEAFWGMVGSVLTFIAILITLWVALDSRNIAITGLAETKRSVDAYISAERGFVVVAECHYDKVQHRINFSFKNIGRSYVLLTLHKHDSQVILADAEPIRITPPDHTHDATFPLAVNEVIRSWQVNGGEALLVGCANPYSLTDKEDISTGKKILVFNVLIEYETMGRFFRHHTTLRYNPPGDSFSPWKSLGYTFTEELSTQTPRY